MLAPKKQIIRKFEPARTEHFVRDELDLYARAAKLIAEVVLERKPNMQPHSERQIDEWIVSLRWFSDKRLKDYPPPAWRIYVLVRWYRDHYDDDEFIPVIESARSLINKFERLEKAMHRRVKRSEEEKLTVPEVLQQNGLVHPRLLDSMMHDVIPATRRLHLIDVADDRGLAEHLVTLYAQVQKERDNASLPMDLKRRLGGPVEILHNYVRWLGEQDWDASSRVLKSDSPAFAKFRRDYRNLEGVDPVDGRRAYE